MKKLFTALAFVFLAAAPLLSQLNVSYVGNFTYVEQINDIWGYTDNTGHEYALVGTNEGLSILDLANPANPVQSAFIPGVTSVWRDIKVWGDYAYVTADQGKDGLMIVDLSNLPTSASHTFYRPELTVTSGTDTLNTSHNIWIDENGIAYVSGSNIGNRGVLFFDVATTPGTPIFLGAEDVEYAHDCFTRGDTLYTADIYGGYFSLYDISNKANPVFLNNQSTPSNFTHNLWLSDNSHTIFTTDEKANAYVGSYDISNPNNINELDRFRPDSTLGTGVIPHNVHVWDDFLIVSYYTDGCIIVDASRPNNLIEVGNFDTYLPASSGFEGVWGAYPYLPSGLILLSDRGNGAYVLQPNYVRACYLEGQVTDTVTGTALNNVSVEILSTLVNESSDISGDYATGYAHAGTYSIRYFKPGYEEKIETVTLSNGVLVMKDVQLMPLPSISLAGTVKQINTSVTLAGVQVKIYNDVFSYSATSDTLGNFTLANFYEGDYTIEAGKWGYDLAPLTNQNISLNTTNYLVSMNQRYYDDFNMDLGWAVRGNASAGDWERVEPTGTSVGPTYITPSVDIQTDYSDKCYVTQDGGNPGQGDVDNGNVILESPSFDLSSYGDPYVSYYTWFVNDFGNSTANDSLNIKISSGGQTVTIESITQSLSAWNPKSMIRIKDFIPVSNKMKLIFETADDISGNILEAGIDVVAIFDSIQVNTHTTIKNDFVLAVAPNPTSDQFVISYQINDAFQKAQFNIYNMVGQLVETHPLTYSTTEITTGDQLQSGVYIVQMMVDGKAVNHLKIVKH